jgi:tRNA1Val (adenine37-N6)-methyltransferase
MKSSIDAETVDSILGGALTVVQPRAGYRFSIDSILLGRFARARSRDRVLDLGAGCGVVGLMIAALSRPCEVVALEIQPELARLAERNATLNGPVIARIMRSIQGDLRARRTVGLMPASFDLIVANPPYRAWGRGRESPHQGRRVARGGSGATLPEFVAAAQRYAAHRGRVAIVFEAARSAELIACLVAHALEPKRIRFVHPTRAAPAASVLIEARKGGGIEATIEPPLILYERPGVYNDEARELMQNESK